VDEGKGSLGKKNREWNKPWDVKQGDELRRKDTSLGGGKGGRGKDDSPTSVPPGTVTIKGIGGFPELGLKSLTLHKEKRLERGVC